eukprot:5230926-Lingulodinium_polyedra.AAC.1
MFQQAPARGSPGLRPVRARATSGQSETAKKVNEWASAIWARRCGSTPCAASTSGCLRSSASAG